MVAAQAQGPPPRKFWRVFDGTPWPLRGPAVSTDDRQQRGGPQRRAAWLSGAPSEEARAGDVQGQMEFLLIRPIGNGLLGWSFDLFSFCFSHGMEGGGGLPSKSLNHALYH